MRTVKLLFICLIAMTNTSIACTTFLLKKDDGLYFGKNYDWDVGLGFLVENKRGLTKTAALVSNPVQWTSKFGSLTFNQFGNEFPNGGMNKAGLVVEIAWLNETKYPEKDERKAITEIQWVQYMLDNFSNVEEVMAAAKELRIENSHAPIHYLIADSLGNYGVIEFLEGKLVTTLNPAIPVLTNNTYEVSSSYVSGTIKYKGVGK